MSSFGEELEICCWTSPFDVIAPYDPSSLLLPASPFETELCSAHWDDLCEPEPVDFFHPHCDPALVPERSPFFLGIGGRERRNSLSIPTQSLSSPPSPRNLTPREQPQQPMPQREQFFEEPMLLFQEEEPQQQPKFPQFTFGSETMMAPPPPEPATVSMAPIPSPVSVVPTAPHLSMKTTTAIMNEAAASTLPILSLPPATTATATPTVPPHKSMIPTLPIRYLRAQNSANNNFRSASSSAVIAMEEEDVAESLTDSEFVDHPSSPRPSSPRASSSRPSSPRNQQAPHQQVLPKIVIDDAVAIDEEGVKARLAQEESKIDLENFKLSSSKSPVIEAFVFCALQNWGVKLKNADSNGIQFEVTDFDYFYERSNRICSKQRPTEDPSARIKGLRRWFPDFPSRRSQISGPFTVSVSGKGKEKAQMVKIKAILEKSSSLVGISKMRKSR